MGAALVAAGDEGLWTGSQLLECGGDVGTARARRVGLGSYEHEIVVHDVAALRGKTFGHELLLGCRVVHEDDIGVTAAAGVQRLARAHGHHAHVNACGLLEGRQQVAEQARLLGAGGAGHHDG